ncbi:hydroxyacid dehydrogenase [Paralcaligenes ginsengisoli]
MRPIVLLTNPIHPASMALLSSQADVRLASDTTFPTLRESSRDADVIIVRATLPTDIFEGTKRLRGAIRHGAGLDMIPVEEASKLGIAVANTPGVNALSVAEYVVGQMIALARQLHIVERKLRSDGWNSARQLSDSATELTGRTVGIVGAGAVGCEVARICHYGLKMRGIGYRRNPQHMPDFIEKASLDILFKESDFLVLTCPLNEHTRGLVNAERLASMKPGAYLVNVARGAVIDEQALADTLINKRLAGAALDVFTEQPLPADSPLLAIPNLILSTHLAGITQQSMQRMSELAAQQAFSLLNGALPRHLVNSDAESHIRARLLRLQKI